MSDTYKYPLDTTGKSPDNLIVRELHTLTDINSRSHRLLVPLYAPFFIDGLTVVRRDPLGVEHALEEGVDYETTNQYLAATNSIFGAALYGSIAIHNTDVVGTILISYQTLGGKWMADRSAILANMASSLYNPRVAAFDQLTNVQEIFPPLPHDQELLYVYDSGDFVEALAGIRDAIVSKGDKLMVKPGSSSRTPESFFFKGR